MTAVEFKTEITRVSLNSVMDVAMRIIREDGPLGKVSDRGFRQNDVNDINLL